MAKHKAKSSPLRRLINRLILLGTIVLVACATGFYFGYRYKANTKVDADMYATDVTKGFISQIASTAQELASSNDLYASVMIAQAVHESDSGQSLLSASPNFNLFGIKGDYNGDSVQMLTWEDDGSGNVSHIYADFRKYPSYYESLVDYVGILKQSWFSGAWKSNTSSYQDATAALTGVYATDTSYNTKLNAIIEEYNLTQYDNATGVSSEAVVWNTYRSQYTSQEILDEDISWANQTGN